MFVQFLNDHPFINQTDETQIVTIQPPKRIRYDDHQSDEEESSDEETFFGQYFEERPNQSDMYDEAYSKIKKEEGTTLYELEAVFMSLAMQRNNNDKSLTCRAGQSCSNSSTQP